jgi:hypothetical protein
MLVLNRKITNKEHRNVKNVAVNMPQKDLLTVRELGQGVGALSPSASAGNIGQLLRLGSLHLSAALHMFEMT